MDLLRGVLVWLPLDRLLDLYPKLPEEFVRDRVASVNQLSDDEVKGLAALTGLPYAARHLWLSAFQGELHRYGPVFVPPSLLLYRAALLRNVAMYRRCIELAGRRVSTPEMEVQLVYQSGSIEMIAALLAGLNGSSLRLIDPVSVRWTPGLVRVTRDYLRVRPYRDEGEIDVIGYLEMIPLDIIESELPEDRLKIHYVRWFIIGRNQRIPGVQPKFTGAELDIIRSFKPNYVGSVNQWFAQLGCPAFPDQPANYSEYIGALIAGVRAVQPNIIELAQDRPTLFNFSPYIGDPIITADFIQRARATIALARQRGWSLDQAYFRDLRVILGERFSGPFSDNITHHLISIAHPDIVAADISDRPGRLPRLSIVYYDLHHLLSLLPPGYPDSHLDVPAIYGWGRFLDLRGRPTFRNMIRPGEDAVPFPFTELAEQQQRFPREPGGLTAEGLRYRRQYGQPIPPAGTSWSLSDVIALEEQLGPRPSRTKTERWSTQLAARYQAFLARLEDQVVVPPITFDNETARPVT